MKKKLEKDISGVVQGHRDGHGFVVLDDVAPDIYLPPNEMRAVLHRDRVRVQVVRTDRKGRPEGRVVALEQRSTQPVVGRLQQAYGTWLLEPEDSRYGQDILLHAVPDHAQPGQIAVAELDQNAALHAQPQGRVTEILGDADDPGMEIDIAVRKHGLPHVFSDAAMQQAQALADTVQAEDLPGRVDLRDIALLTIDGEDARDFDDAVYCEPAVLGGRGKNVRKGWRLLVAIADVSHYVRNNSPLDVDAYERATSVYFPRRVIPMLPEKLSNGLCSLNPGVDRLCMVCDMLIDLQGEVQAYQFYPAVMHSHARLTYTEVAAILDNTTGPQARQHAQRLQDLLHLHAVYQALLAARAQRGAMDLETVETQIVCNDSGQIEKIMPRTRTDAHRLIEEAMLAANVCAADFIAHHKAAGLYRIHEQPSQDKIDILRNYLRTLGVPARISDSPDTAELAAIAASTRDRPDAAQIHTMLLRSMQQAIYSPDNLGHFGLAYSGYTHFTSPIRRYPDLLVHRVIKSILLGQNYQLPTLPEPGEAQARLAQRLQKNRAAPAAAGKKSKKPSKATAAQTDWQAAGLHCSAHERRADEASRDVQAWLKCQYASHFVGDILTGTVTAVTSFGLFVTLDNMFVEGLVHITELGSDYFRYDEAAQQLRGERTGICFALGHKVTVQIARVDVDGRRIDFRLVQAGRDAQPASSSRQRAARRAASRAGERDAQSPQDQKAAPVAGHAAASGDDAHAQQLAAQAVAGTSAAPSSSTSASAPAKAQRTAKSRRKGSAEAVEPDVSPTSETDSRAQTVPAAGPSDAKTGADTGVEAGASADAPAPASARKSRRRTSGAAAVDTSASVADTPTPIPSISPSSRRKKRIVPTKTEAAAPADTAQTSSTAASAPAAPAPAPAARIRRKRATADSGTVSQTDPAEAGQDSTPASTAGKKRSARSSKP